MGKPPSDSLNEESTISEVSSSSGEAAYTATATFEPINPANAGPVISASKKPDSDDDSLE